MQRGMINELAFWMILVWIHANRNAPARMRGKSLGLARHGAHLKYPDPSFFEAAATFFPRRVDVRFTPHPVALPVARVAL